MKNLGKDQMNQKHVSVAVFLNTSTDNNQPYQDLIFLSHKPFLIPTKDNNK